MILYFSATGNSKYVAERVARATGDDAVSIAECVKAGRTEFAPGAYLGIISPTYCWALPTIVEGFLKKAVFIYADKTYVYYISTYGAISGRPVNFADRALRRNNLRIDACFGVKMPDTWTPAVDLSDPANAREINARAEPMIDAAIAKIVRRESGDFMADQTSLIAAIFMSRFQYSATRKTSHLRVESACVGCGLCAEKCPMGAIEMRGGRPAWVLKRCAMCLGCLHRCPKFAIQYGENTRSHGQYVNPNAKI